MKHNDIVLKINKERLALLLCHKFGDMGCWSPFHWVVQKKIDDWKQEETAHLLQTLREETFDNLKDIKEKFVEASKSILELSKEKSLQIEKTFEFPIIKGDGQYKCTKGFIDLIVHCRPIRIHQFSTYQKDNPIEFVIEIKKEKDFDDFGDILRQIKEYREYYNTYGIKRWTSQVMPTNEEHRYGNSGKDFIFCVLSTKIPNNIKELFEDEGIMCLELDSLNAPSETSPEGDSATQKDLISVKEEFQK